MGLPSRQLIAAVNASNCGSPWRATKQRNTTNGLRSVLCAVGGGVPFICGRLLPPPVGRLSPACGTRDDQLGAFSERRPMKSLSFRPMSKMEAPFICIRGGIRAYITTL